MTMTELTSLERLDASLHDEVGCDVVGCFRRAQWRSKCRDCDGSTLLICDRCRLLSVNDLYRKQMAGVVIQCVESKQTDKPLKMVLFIPLPSKP